ncbi:MmpS family transport accessory protein [Actinomadura sp. 3N508]|uniref:MmpS family transport accessory protein n=1 Tax=Actinomadura sp. 3N508 TaxID=3375153 RepID=UPI0037B4AC8D
MSVPGGAYGGGPPGAPGGQPRPDGTNTLAIASLVLGITWLCWIGSILAVVLGHVSLSQIKRTGQSGRGMAIAGLILGYIGILAGAIVVVFFVALGNEIGNEIEEKRTRVALEASGSGGATRADITYSFGKDPSQANGQPLPWRKAESRNVGGSDLLQVNAQNSGERGSVTCRIRVDGKVVTSNTSTGPYAVASCSYNRWSQ